MKTSPHRPPLRIAGIGCGPRTRIYLKLAAAIPECYQVVAAADPNAGRVETVRSSSNNPEFRAFPSAAEMLAVPKFADVMVIGTQDALHKEHAIAAMEAGYDLLLEKPIATTLEDCNAVEETASRLGRKVVVCHVLRYTPFYREVKRIIDSGELGEIITLNATEGVGAWHQAHSYVRGHWANVEKASPMILSKSSHDMDIIRWLAGRPCERMSSFGSLTYFRKENAPPGAPLRCTDGCPVADTCHYNSAHYATTQRTWLSYVYDRIDTATPEEIHEWLKTSPWGRCVYHCDNTAVDHQTVGMEFAGGLTATFTMTAFANHRHIEIYGTKGRLRGGEAVKETTGADIIVHKLDGTGERRWTQETIEGELYAHGGGDFGLVRALYDEINLEDPRQMTSSLHVSLASHRMAFAGEQSRLTRQVVELADA